MSDKRFEVVLNEFDEVEYIIDKKFCEDKDFAEFMDFVEELAKENEQLRKENEEYEEESEDMQTKINVLYNEAKKHMSSTEWEKFIRRIIEREEELGIKWVRL